MFERGGFRHDAGPTVITAPFLFDELFALFGERREDHVEFRALDPWYRFYFHTGEQFDYRPSIEDTNEEIRRFSPRDVTGYAKLLKVSKAIFDIGFVKLADKPFTKLTDMLAQIPSLLRLQSYHSVAGIVHTYIKHPLLRQAFSIHPLLVGRNGKPCTVHRPVISLKIFWRHVKCVGDHRIKIRHDGISKRHDDAVL